MRPRTLFLAGLALGAFLGFAFLVAGPLTLLPGLVIVAWLVTRQQPAIGLAGALTGFGVMWLALLGQASYRCALDPSCLQPDGEFWLLIGAAILSCGLALAVAARWAMRYR